MQATQEQIRDSNLALHVATSRLLDDAETLRQRRDELLRLVTITNASDETQGATDAR
jgi:hypothetical protein